MARMLINFVVVIYTIYIIYKLYKEYKEINRLDGKTIFWLIIIIFVFPTIIYYLDKYNVASNFMLLENTNSNKWFNFITSYITTIISAIIGALALIIMTMYQLREQREKDLDDRRINNLPFLQYDFIVETTSIHSNYYEILTSVEDGINLSISLKIKNIGMNNARKCYIKPTSSIIKKTYDYKLDEQELLAKDEEKTISFYLNLKPKEKYSFKFIIKFQDMQFNWYEQEVLLICELTSYFNNNGYQSIISKVVNDEKKKEKVKIDLGGK